MVSRVGWLLLAIGLFVGPGYWIVTKFFSGHALASLPLPCAGAGCERRATLTVTPSDSPVRLIVRASADYATTRGQPPVNAYAAEVTRDGRSVARSELMLRGKSIDSNFEQFRSVVATLEIDAPAEIGVTLRESAPPEMRVHDMTLEVRGAAREPATGVVVAGIALLVAAVALIALG